MTNHDQQLIGLLKFGRSRLFGKVNNADLFRPDFVI